MRKVQKESHQHHVQADASDMTSFTTTLLMMHKCNRLLANTLTNVAEELMVTFTMVSKRFSQSLVVSFIRI